MIKKLPRLCFVGNMLGKNLGRVISQGEILCDHLAREGFSVICTSSALNQIRRISEIIWIIICYRKQIDIQCIQVFSGAGFIITEVASLLAHMLGHRIVLVLRGGNLPEFALRHPWRVKAALQRADVVVAPSTYLANALRKWNNKIQVIPNVINLSLYPYKKRDNLNPALFWMRAFDPTYNPEMAIRVLARVREKYPNASLVMAGQAEKGGQSAIKEIAHQMGLADAITFPGFLDMQKKKDFAAQTDIFINTNKIDNMPVSVVEACAFGLPVVATDVGGIRDMLTDGETGLLVPDNDDKAMADVIMRLIADPILAGSLSKNGRRLAEQSAWERVYPLWMQVFFKVMPRK